MGTTSNGKAVTLYECYRVRSKASVSGYQSSSFTVSKVFVGHCFERKEDIVFDSLSLSYSHLEEWTRISGFQFGIDRNQEGGLRKFEVSYIFPDKKEAKVSDINLSFDYDFVSRDQRINGTVKEVNLKQTTFIRIQPREPLHFDDFYDHRKGICRHIQNFLTFAI